MKIIYSFICILFCGLSSIYSQTGETSIASYPKLDAKCFVLGTLSDYMGRFYYVDRQNQVDRYHSYEKPAVDYLTGYLTKELGVAPDSVSEERGKINMYSAELSKSLNHFYGSKDELVDSMLKTDQQIYSFLAGVYYRYGEKLDTGIYKIQLANSPKHQSCYDLLKRAGCTKIFFKYLRHIPAQYILYFEPTPELEAYLAILEPQKLLLKESYYAFIKEPLKASMSDEEFDQLLHKHKEKERLAIKSSFQIK